jgi:pimeloyl-ACP methyl ester carboxylesterase
MRTISGPIVLVAHSYGGAVTSLAATQVTNVKALVYLDALALEAGESNIDILERFPSKLFPALQPRPFPQPDGSEGTDLYIDAVPVGLRRRPLRQDCGADGHCPASHIAGRGRGEVHRAGLEDDPLLVPGRAPGPGLHR